MLPAFRDTRIAEPAASYGDFNKGRRMRALIVTNLQGDYLPGGPVAVPGADELSGIANSLLPKFDVTVAVRDWHPPDHASFAANHEAGRSGDMVFSDDARAPEIRLWPIHCLRGTRGAEFDDDFDIDDVQHIVELGSNPAVDAWSAFRDQAGDDTGLASWLKARDVNEVFVMGVPLEYHVAQTALDAQAQGFTAAILTDACRAAAAAAGVAALDNLRQRGVATVASSDLPGVGH